MKQQQPKPQPKPKDWRDEPFEDFIKKIDPSYRPTTK